MRDIPGLAWILGIFAIGAIGLFFYTRLGPGALPQARSIWADVEKVRMEIETRNLKISPRESSGMKVYPFSLQIDRLSNQPMKEGSAARYILHFTGPAKIGSNAAWLSAGVDVGLVDLNPEGLVGTVRLAAVQRNTADE